MEEFQVNKKKNSHIVLATHDPVVLSTLKKEQIQVMKRDESSMQVYAKPPSHDPKGLGVTGVLMSDMFGLRSDLDGETLANLDEHAQLLASDDLSDQEEQRFEELKDILSHSGFMHAYSDPYFNAFVKEWVLLGYSKKYSKPFLSDNDRASMKEAAKQIMKKLSQEVG